MIHGLNSCNRMIQNLLVHNILHGFLGRESFHINKQFSIEVSYA